MTYVKIERYFTTKNTDVFSMFKWKKVDVSIKNYSTGQIIFEANGLEFPEHYSDNACDIIAKMYFRKKGVPGCGHETSLKQVVSRMADFWTKALVDEKIINKKDAKILFDELVFIMLSQMWAPNTPQWFNTGLYHSYGIKGVAQDSFAFDKKLGKVTPCSDATTPASACFITTVKDQLLGDQSLSDHLCTATRLFSYGSGVGSNWSDIRGDGEALSGGGVSSGVLSFLKVFDKNAGAIKSGGTHRRSSVLNVIDLDHPDIFDFINWKVKEEDKVRALAKMGYDTSFTGEAYETVSGQNCNNSVAISDTFMELLKEKDSNWMLKGRVDRSKDREIKTKELWDAICEAAWLTGDPGVQFTDTINEWNTVPHSGRIKSSNPCFAYETRILTADGYQRIGDLKDQEVLLVNADGVAAKGKVWSSGIKPTITLVLADGTKITCTPDHQFKTAEGETVKAKNLLGKALATFTDCNTDQYYDERYMAIGSSYEPSDDEEINFSKMTLSEKRSFLRGYFNKHAVMNDGFLEISNPNGDLIYTIVDLLADLDVEASISVTKDEEKMYVVSISGYLPSVMFVGNIGTSDNRTVGLFDDSPRVISIKPDVDQEVFDFSEPLTNWGVVEGVVAHNCSEFLFLNDSSCNLSSINLIKFYDKETEVFNYLNFIKVVEMAMLVMEASCHWGSYPTPQIAENTYKFRPLGLGITNLGALLMSMALPYDSDEGRDIAASIMSLLTATAYETSARMAKKIGPFEEFDKNKVPMLNVIQKHMEAWLDVPISEFPNWEAFNNATTEMWKDAIDLGNEYGYRNATVSLVAPAGTISFAMNADSTGLEPFFSHIVYKKVADGSFMGLANNVIGDGLETLGYDQYAIEEILEYVKDHEKIEGAPHLEEEHLPIFDTANRCGDGVRFISPEGHVRMIAAIQPHMSMGASKTVNLPCNATIEDISNIYKLAHELGCKCIALYRDGCKLSQPLTTSKEVSTAKAYEDMTYQELLNVVKSMPNANECSLPATVEISRKRLPVETNAIKNEVEMDDQSFHVIRSFYDDGKLGEIFMTVGKNGSTVKGLQEVLCMIVSKALQYGVPPEVLAKTMRHHEFPPNGLVFNHPFIKSASSIPDLMSKFLDISQGNYKYCQVKPDSVNVTIDPPLEGVKFEAVYGDICSECGSNKIVKAGVCKYCQACGSSTGCS